MNKKYKIIGETEKPLLLSMAVQNAAMPNPVILLSRK